MDLWSATAWEPSLYIDPAFWTIMVSGTRFSSPEEAEKYGRAAFGEYFAGVQQVSWVNDEKPF